ncbi:hypothetical protein F5Y06DRAFT_290641 [Hypoxylon sp. FL0890]|nr:hypothetical protein F5Y06DRAFT_290641 [Hypoxylon sp. FL0890]
MEFVCIVIAIYVIFCVVSSAASSFIPLEPSATPPPSIASPIDPSFAGFDYMMFQENQDNWTWIENPNAAGQGTIKPDNMLIGPRFFEAANRLPNGTTNDYIEQITTMAKQALTNTPNLNITSFEIGNEPDLYTQNGFRTGEWRGKIYTQQWLDRASAVQQQVLQPLRIRSNVFEAGATASTIGTDFQIADLVGYDILSEAGDPSTSYLSGWNQHNYYYYIGVSGYTLTLEHLMDLKTTEDQFEAWADELKRAQQTPYPYALREMGVVGPIGLAGVTDVFGTSLWTLNFLLYAASLGVSSVGFHMTDNSNASAWQPTSMYGLQPHVRPLYYAIAAFDQVIGSSPTTQILQYQMMQGSADDYNDFIRTYSVYQEQQLASMIIINARMVNSTQQNKGGITIQLQLPTNAAVGRETVYLSYLTNDGADSTLNTTWNGISFELSDDGTPTQVSDSQRTVLVDDDGIAKFTVRDSEAVVASLGGKVGRDMELATSSCSAPSQDGANDPRSRTSCPEANETNTPKLSGAVAPPSLLFHTPMRLCSTSLSLVIGVLTL